MKTRLTTGEGAGESERDGGSRRREGKESVKWCNKEVSGRRRDRKWEVKAEKR